MRSTINSSKLILEKFNRSIIELEQQLDEGNPRNTTLGRAQRFQKMRKQRDNPEEPTSAQKNRQRFDNWRGKKGYKTDKQLDDKSVSKSPNTNYPRTTTRNGPYSKSIIQRMKPAPEAPAPEAPAPEAPAPEAPAPEAPAPEAPAPEAPAPEAPEPAAQTPNNQNTVDANVVQKERIKRLKAYLDDQMKGEKTPSTIGAWKAFESDPKDNPEDMKDYYDGMVWFAKGFLNLDPGKK